MGLHRGLVDGIDVHGCRLLRLAHDSLPSCSVKGDRLVMRVPYPMQACTCCSAG